MTTPRIKGTVLKTRLALVEELGGAEGRESVLASLDSEDRSALSSLLATKWYPFELGQRLDDVVVRVLGGGKTGFFERLGEASATKNLGSVHRDFLVEGDPQAFLAKAPLIYSFYYDQGRREHQATGPRDAVLTTYDAETFSVTDCLTVVGWHRRGLEMCGAKDVRIVEEECRARGGGVCRYRLAWS